MKNEIYSEITDILLTLGFKPKYHGFDFLRDIVYIYSTSDVSEDKLTIDAYPMVAEKYNSTTMIVERSIRLMIREAFEEKRLLNLNILFDEVVYDGSYSFSNNELITLILELIRFRQLKKEFDK